MDFGPDIANQKAFIIEDECIGCKKCIDACPVDAIHGASNLMHSVIVIYVQDVSYAYFLVRLIALN